MIYREYYQNYSTALNKGWRWWIGELLEIFNSIKNLKKIDTLHYEAAGKSEIRLKDNANLIRSNSTYNIELKFNDHNILYRKIKLPNAAKKDIDRVINYEFNRYFPLNMDDALLSYKVIQSSSNKESIEVEMWVVNKALVDHYLGQIREMNGFNIRTLSIINSDGLNVIEHDVSRSKRINRREVAPVYSKHAYLAIMVLLPVLLGYSLYKMDIYLESLQKKVTELEKNAQPILEIRDKIWEKEERLQHLINQKAKNPDQAFIWSHITSTLAGHVVLDRMEIRGRRINIQGKARSVERIIKILEADAGFTNVIIDGPVAVAGKDGYETMKISMSINK